MRPAALAVALAVAVGAEVAAKPILVRGSFSESTGPGPYPALFLFGIMPALVGRYAPEDVLRYKI